MTADPTTDELTFHAWPPSNTGGQHVRQNAGVLAVHTHFGVGVMCMDERSQMRNRDRAVKMLRALTAPPPVITIKADLTPAQIAQMKAFQEMPRLCILEDAESAAPLHANPDHDSLHTRFEQLERILDCARTFESTRDVTLKRMNEAIQIAKLIRAQVLK